MMQNALKHVNSDVRSVLAYFIDHIEENEFVIAWDHMPDEHKVHDNNWLSIIFGI